MASPSAFATSRSAFAAFGAPAPTAAAIDVAALRAGVLSRPARGTRRDRWSASPSSLRWCQAQGALRHRRSSTLVAARRAPRVRAHPGEGADRDLLEARPAAEDRRAPPSTRGRVAASITAWKIGPAPVTPDELRSGVPIEIADPDADRDVAGIPDRPVVVVRLRRAGLHRDREREIEVAAAPEGKRARLGIAEDVGDPERGPRD